VFARWEGGDEENKWQRAVVLEHHGRSTNVLFVDTGLQGEVEEIRTADLQIVLSLEAQAIECYISEADVNKYSAKVVKSLINKKVCEKSLKI
jgi:Tudor domain